MADTIASLKHQLSQLKELHESGVLPAPQYEEGKATLERRVLDLVLQGPDSTSTPAAPMNSPSSGPSGRLFAALAVGVVVIAGAGYWWKGSPTQIGSNPAAVAAGAAGDSPEGTPHATNFDQISAMTERLAVRMKEQPKDAEGWAMLARSYSVLGRHPEALKAYEQAIALRKDDATLLADYADSLAIKNNRSLDGEPMKWVASALKVDPRNLKALSLAGTHAFDRKDYTAAIGFWEKVVQFGPADSSIVQQVEPGLAEARGLAGLPPAAKPLDAPAKPAASSAATVSGTVTLAAALRGQAKPDDTVFIFARAAEGSKMPLAIVRKQVKDLPFQFVLDDSTSMSPASKLSTSAAIIVGARVSKSGNAIPQPGDLSGQSGKLEVGAKGIQLEIKEVVKP